MKKILISFLFGFLLIPSFGQSLQNPKKTTLAECDKCIVGNIVISEQGVFSKFKPVTLSSIPYSCLMVGVYHEIDINIVDLMGKHTKKGYSVATKGIVEVKYNQENGIIKKGDPVTSSSTPGVAMKATQSGMILGVALEDATGSKGLVKIRVMIQYLNF